MMGAGLVLLLQGRLAFAESGADPAQFIESIYREAVAGTEPNWMEPAPQRLYLSKSLNALWRKTDPRIVPGDEGPIDFDMIADTNGLSLKGFSLAVERRTASTATIAVTLAYDEEKPRPKPSVVRYDLIREGGSWKIDNIRGRDWSARHMLARFLSSP